MASVSPSLPCTGDVIAKRQLTKGFWVDRKISSAAGCDFRLSRGPYSRKASSVGFVVVGPKFARSSCFSRKGLLVLHSRAGRRGVHLSKRLNCVGSSDGSGEGKGEDEVDEALNLDGQIPTTSDGFLKQVASSAYDLRRQFEQNVESSSYDVLESNPWRDSSKPVYVLAQDENRLLTMRTRLARSEVESELSMLFSKRGSRRGRQGRPSAQTLGDDEAKGPSASDDRFRMLVEDVREGVLVFEDEEEATRYCSLLDGQGKGCVGIAELEASEVFAVCQKTQRLAVLFRRGTTPPQPDRLQLNLKARTVINCSQVEIVLYKENVNES
ncbi:hypothetical protein R1sor_010750 [Riccia sorocarpa]|uniref:Uncharacterized protein n=1 Tax=Riccia sorocarpa TaxID=122646 RepID=A0ABD3I2C2_9MARC